MPGGTILSSPLIPSEKDVFLQFSTGLFQKKQNEQATQHGSHANEAQLSIGQLRHTPESVAPQRWRDERQDSLYHEHQAESCQKINR
jgi:hypothetical protein